VIAGVWFTVMLRFPVVAVKLSESVTFTAKVKGPAVVGFGLFVIAPVLEFKVNPFGSAPEAIVKAYPVKEPPLAVNGEAE
jgi:hypothetical protein